MNGLGVGGTPRRALLRHLLGVCLVVLVATPALVGLGACGTPGAGFEADDLLRAEFAMMNATGDKPVTSEIDLSDPAQRDRLLKAYASMGPAKGVRERLPSSDLSLTLFLTDDRRAVILLARDDYPYVVLDKYEGDDLTATYYMQPGTMYEYMTELADRSTTF